MNRRQCIRLIILIILASLSIYSQTASSQQCEGRQLYYVASMNMTIDPGSEDFIISSLNDAKLLCANNFILIMNTFGGNGANMDHIISAISDYQGWGGRFITLVAPSGAHAFSAGAYIAEASNEIYMTPGTAIGSATPIVYSIPPGQENTTLTKDINGFKAYMEALTSKFGRNTTATALMVTKGISYTAEEAFRLNVINGVINANSIDDALRALGVPSGTEVHTPGIRSLMLSIIADPNVSGLLFLVGVFAVLADIYHPTVLLSITGIVLIALALLGLGVFGAPIASIILMLVGSGLIFLELKTQHGLSALAGVIVFIIGFLLIFSTPPPPTNPNPQQPPQANFFSISLLTYVLLGLLGGGIVIASIYLYKIREGLARRPRHFDLSHLIGKEGRLLTDLKAGGLATANIASEEWTVTSTQDIERGSIVKVKEVLGLKLVVEKKE